MELDQLKNIFNTFYQNTFISITLLDEDKNLLFPNYSPLYHRLHEYSDLCKKDEYPIHIINNYNYLMAAFSYERYWILVGPNPLLDAPPTNDYFAQFHAYVSTHSLDSFVKSVVMIYAFLTHEYIEEDQIPVHYVRKEISHNTKETVEKNLFNRRSADTTKDSYQFELLYLDYVRRGKKDKINWIFSQMNKTYEVHLSEDQLQSMLIKFIALVTLMTRMVIDMGVPLDSAFSLSDALIQNIDKIKTPQEAQNYIKYASFEFIDLIQSMAKKSSVLINQCLNYIDAHLYEKINLQDLGAISGYSAIYISSRFKKEMGVSFSEYLLNRKIEEAKQLLLFTDYSLQEIAALLNFTSQSHFTQRFKHVTQLTPKQFRNKNFQYM